MGVLAAFASVLLTLAVLPDTVPDSMLDLATVWLTLLHDLHAVSAARARRRVGR